jgi:hypothetical protein
MSIMRLHLSAGGAIDSTVADRSAKRKGVFMSNEPTSKDSSTPPLGSLGDLASSTRQSHISSVIGIFLIVGLLEMGFGGFKYWNSAKEVDDVLAAEIKAAGPDAVIDEEAVASAKAEVLGMVRFIYGLEVFVGVVFIVLALLVTRYPVVITILGLLLYLAMIGLAAFFDPSQLVRGLLIKILIIVSLVRAISAARAEQNVSPAPQGPLAGF